MQGIIAFTVLYNIWCIILRIAFFDDLSYTFYQRFGFFCLDFVTDILLMLDVFSKFRLGYLDEGIMVKSFNPSNFFFNIFIAKSSFTKKIY